ncbi:MAG: CRISPR-associated endonuclease Cas2 [Ardenticatenales bacterium]|nr:CRISPR-associated endonuclease Cas2 [Ardenticatenales bacterium]
MFVVVSYDISDDRRRLKVLNTMKDFGKRVQYSVFECVLNDPQLTRLQERLGYLIEPQEDKVHFYYLCEKCVQKMERLRGAREPVLRPYYIIGRGEPS